MKGVDEQMHRKAQVLSTQCSVVVGKKEKDVIVNDIALCQGYGEITLHRDHRVSSIKRKHLEELYAVSRKLVTEHARSGCELGTDVSLSALKWLQAVLKSEAKVFWGRTFIMTLWVSCRTSTYILVSAVRSDSWDDGGTISSFVGSTLMVLIGRGFSD